MTEAATTAPVRTPPAAAMLRPLHCTVPAASSAPRAARSGDVPVSHLIPRVTTRPTATATAKVSGDQGSATTLATVVQAVTRP